METTLGERAALTAIADKEMPAHRGLSTYTYGEDHPGTHAWRQVIAVTKATGTTPPIAHLDLMGLERPS